MAVPSGEPPSHADAARVRAKFHAPNGDKVVGHFSEELRGAALSALGSYGESLVMVEGAVVRDQSDNRKSIEQVTRIELLDALDVPARLEALALLRDGWLDGDGSSLPLDGLTWLSKAWVEHWPEDLPLPHVYPTPEGMVQLEWSMTDRSASAEIDTARRTAEVLVSRTADGEILVEASFSLSVAGAWQAMAKSLCLRDAAP